MANRHKPYIPQSIDDIYDLLGWIMLYAPHLADKTGYFPEKNADTTFQSLNDGLEVVRNELGMENYEAAIRLSQQMRAHFQADVDDEKPEESLRGRECILELEKILVATALNRKD